MKIKSKIGDGLFISLVIYSILTLAMYVVWVVTSVWWPAVVLSAILIIVIAPIYFGTYYELTRTELRIYSGVFGKAIPYRAIISMTDADSISPAFCLSHQRILIRYMENDVICSTYVSPANRDQFRDLVNAEMNRAVEIYKDAPKSSFDKAVATARKQKIEPTKAEIKATEIATEAQEEESRQELNQELKRLDEVIGKTVTPEQRKRAEQKLLKKVRKLKQKQEERERAQEYLESRERERAQAEKAHEAKAHQAMLAEEKAKIKAAIEEAKKDQYVPPKQSKASTKTNAGSPTSINTSGKSSTSTSKNAGENSAASGTTKNTSATTKKTSAKANNLDLSKPKAKKNGLDVSTPQKEPAESEKPTATKTASVKTAKAQIKKAKVEEAKKSKAVVKTTKKKQTSK